MKMSLMSMLLLSMRYRFKSSKILLRESIILGAVSLFGLFTEVETITSQVVSSFSMPDLRCNSTSNMLSDDASEMVIH